MALPSLHAQQPTARQAPARQAPAQPDAQAAAGQNNAAPAHPVHAQLNDNAAPFPPLEAAAQQQLDQLLMAWESQSKGTKTLECQFQRWHYDLFAAPAGVHATKCEGMIRYAAPDKGSFKVETKVFFNGMKEGKPQFAEKPGQFGEHWVCNGEEILEFDRSVKQCKIQQLPPNMRGQQIFDSPLPFVFNLDAAKIKQRYWVRQVQAPKEGIVLIEAYPKRQEDRAQYKLVQIALNQKTFLPEALLMYAPNFNVKTAPKWDHYEFANVKRNSLTQGLGMFLRNFIDEKPPADWKVFRNQYNPPGPPQMAQQPQPGAPQRQ